MNTKNCSKYVLDRRANPEMRDAADWFRLNRAEAKRERRANRQRLRNS